MPELHEAVSQAVREKDLRWFDAERAVMGFGHDRINAWLARHWNLPGNIREGMSHHHSPETAQLYPETAAAVHIGDWIVRIYEYGTGGDDQAAVLSKKALDMLKLKLSDMDRILDEFAGQLAEVSDLDMA